ncbi:2Fe-2S iron-sulfur cluster-binding protein [Ferviditalea candida]|uniref:2Fe-2S iron-sulfur cluster-binding protein n=1 Tax=Ferviditalea candida TaxID=3108399 RepID=A0ABU5ZLT0_9BACL|nr:2Fe-2S iron-sulfur cluster-binding protein [Paenibacillaceae bacterium T2]
MLELKGKRTQKDVGTVIGRTILEHALEHKVEWGFSCVRGTCARCRTFVAEGRDNLGEPTKAERDRLDPEEIEEGYRLGCQAVIVKEGRIVVVNSTYF